MSIISEHTIEDIYRGTTDRIYKVDSDLRDFITETISALTSMFSGLRDSLTGMVTSHGALTGYTQNTDELPSLKIYNPAEMDALKMTIDRKLEDISRILNDYKAKVSELDYDDTLDTSQLDQIEDIIRSSGNVSIPLKDIPSVSTPEIEQPQLNLPPAPNIDIDISAPTLNIQQPSEYPLDYNFDSYEAELNNLINKIRSLEEINFSQYQIPEIIETKYFDYIRDTYKGRLDEIKQTIMNFLTEINDNFIKTGGKILSDNTLQSMFSPDEREIRWQLVKKRKEDIVRNCAIRGFRTLDRYAKTAIDEQCMREVLTDLRSLDGPVNSAFAFSSESYSQAVSIYYRVYPLLSVILTLPFFIEREINRLNYLFGLQITSILLDAFKSYLQKNKAEIDKTITESKKIITYAEYLKSKINKERINLIPEENRTEAERLKTEYLATQMRRYAMQLEAFNKELQSKQRTIAEYVAKVRYYGAKAVIAELKNRKLVEEMEYAYNNVDMNVIYNRVASRINRLLSDVAPNVPVSAIVNDYRSYIDELVSYNRLEASNAELLRSKIEKIADETQADMNLIRTVGNFYRKATSIDLEAQSSPFRTSLLNTIHQVSLVTLQAIYNMNKNIRGILGRNLSSSRSLEYAVESILSAVSDIVSLTNKILEEV